ncbi:MULTISPECIES: response regulator transcription factor [Actinomadura]|uniref:Sensory transduction protein RegX3 n=1 Tax=Actinomadura yumaensis TaxID=111807 RepID=A0ABW2CQF2_9ACTN|nr:response regulator transcription factor [Actinomadura sp. J1-007]MWK40443.1 response regulator [Actinomadura sp. J1-007]
MRVLVVEDDDRFAEALASALTDHRHKVVRAGRADDGLRLARHADIVLLDLGLPDRPGLTALAELRRVSSVPLIVVTCSGEDHLVLRGLRAGADDYLVKPFRTDVLLARMDAVMRRGGRPRRGGCPVVEVGDVRVDLDARRVTVAGAPAALTHREFDVLALLAEDPGVVCTREKLLSTLWRDTMPSSSCSLNVHVANLRSKTGRPGLIVTLRGVGYRLGG